MPEHLSDITTPKEDRIMAITATTPRANSTKTMNNFGWPNLASTDDAAAATFYGRIFGWDWDVMPLMEGMVHRNAHLGGLQIAGLDATMPGLDMPTAWTNFVYVADIEKTVATARQLGATIVADVMDVMGEGHMAVVLDPTGAAFGLWQPGRHTGADAVNQPGTYTWVELATDDAKSAMRFYGELFGWSYEKQDMVSMEYWMVQLEGRAIAGLMRKPQDMAQMPSHWGTYFGVADIDATAAEVTDAGGTVLFEPMKMGPGRGFAALDPQGGYFMTIQLDEWPAE